MSNIPDNHILQLNINQTGDPTDSSRKSKEKILRLGELASLKPDFHGKHLMLEWTSGKQEKVTPDRGNANHIE